MKRIITIALCLLIMAAVLCGCNKTVYTGTTSASPTEAAANATEAAAQPATTREVDPVTYEPKATDKLIDISEVPAQDLSGVDADYQSKPPVEGEEVAILHTNYGDICIKFFPEAAPMAVTNFKALAKAGRYDSTIFHRIFHQGINGIQGGDYTKYAGTGGESAFGQSFGYEVSDFLSNTPGSVAMAHSSLPDSNGSQFYINSGDNSTLDGGYTVFAQVYDGMDVVNTIASIETDSSERPLTEVILDKVEIIPYAAK